MSMIKIFNIDGGVVSEAWIGDDSPMPDGWHLDVASAMEANPVKPAKKTRKAKAKPVEVEVKADAESEDKE